MSVIAPNFKLSEFIKSILDVGFWTLLILVLIGIPAIMFILFFIEMPVINGELLTPFLALTWLADPSRVLPIIKAFMTTDLFRIAAFPGFGFAALIAAGTIFVERKMLAKLQLRVGPFYCGKIEGILQLMGDGLKLISKEIIIPAKADKPLFWAAPVLFVATAAAFVALIPVTPGWVVADVDVGLLAVFAVIGFFPIITILSAWAANSKFPFIGGIRAIVFFPIGAIVFFITMLAELERIPFDLPEAESEIVAGWLTELSGMMYGLVQLGTYLKLYAFAGLFVVVFLGGWNGPMVVPPFPAEIITEGIELGPVTAQFPGLPIFSQEMLNGIVWFVLKTVGVIFFILLPRGVFPRIRIDLLLDLGWKKLIGLAFVNIFIALGLLYAGILGPGGLF
jgi:NADH-quinone oxidoreductase subunit H